MGKTAIDAPRGTYFLMDPDDLTVIEDRSHPLFDPRALEPPEPALVASIRIHGVDKAVKAIKDGDRCIVVDGRRRTIAAQEAKRLNLKEGGPAPKVKVELHRGDERSAVARMVLGNFSPKEESMLAKARKAQILAGLNYPEDEIATLFGVTAGTVNNWLTLLELAKPVQAAVERSTVRLVDAVKLGKLPRDEQPAALSKLEVERPTRAARKARGDKPNGKAAISPARRLRRLEAFLGEARGEPVPWEFCLLFDWLQGKASNETFAKKFPALAPMFERPAKGKGARHVEGPAPHALLVPVPEGR